MATTAQSARIADYLLDDILVVSASGSQITTPGDWMQYSGKWAIPGTDQDGPAHAYKVSAAGMAMEANPTYDHLGRTLNNSGLTVARRGYLRVSAGNSGTAYTLPLGAFAYQNGTGSGIVGQTGATGVGQTWVTAPPVGISAGIGALTATVASGVAIVVNHPIGGDSGVGQIDIYFNLATNFGYF